MHDASLTYALVCLDPFVAHDERNVLVPTLVRKRIMRRFRIDPLSFDVAQDAKRVINEVTFGGKDALKYNA